MTNLSFPEIPTDTELTTILIANINLQLSHYGWTLRELSDRSGMPYESIKKLLGYKIRRPSFYSIWMIARALGCSLESLTVSGRQLP